MRRPTTHLRSGGSCSGEKSHDRMRLPCSTWKQRSRALQRYHLANTTCICSQVTPHRYPPMIERAMRGSRRGAGISTAGTSVCLRPHRCSWVAAWVRLPYT